MEVVPDHEALELGDEVGVEVQLPVAQLQAEVGVALADGHQPVACANERNSDFWQLQKLFIRPH